MANDGDEATARLVAEVASLRRRVAELERARSTEGAGALDEERVRREHRFLNSVLQSISFPLYVIDVQTYEILLANTATCPTAVPKGLTCHALTHHRTTPCGDAEALCPIEEVRASKKPVVIEHVHFDKDGAPRHFEIHAFPILDADGNVVQMIEYNIDQTDRKRVEDELRNHHQSMEMLVQQLARSNEELREFTSIAAHDMRSPMALIVTAAAELKESLQAKLDENERMVLDILMRGIDRTTEMITSLYRCGQVDVEESHWTEIDLNRVVDELRSFQLAADLGRSQGTLRVPASLHVVLGDEIQILELLQNLIANGLKYHRKGVAPEVTVRSRALDNRRVRVEVEDNGIGIRDADRHKLFTMFKRLDDAREHEGLGIGLTFCQRVAKRHGGRIGVQSTYGVGSTFWVDLPAPSPQG